MALKAAPQVVNALHTLFQDGRLSRGRRSVATTTIPAVLSAWYDIDLPRGALRDTLACVGIEAANGRYDVTAIYENLYGDNPQLRRVADRALAQMTVGEVRVVRVEPDSEVLGGMFLAVDVLALGTRRLVQSDDSAALGQAVREGLRLAESPEN